MKRYYIEALGLRPRNNRVRSIMRCAGPELRATVRELFAADINKTFKSIYGSSVERLVGPSHPFFANVAIY